MKVEKEILGLCKQFRVELIEDHAMPEHVYLCVSIPPKYSIANTVGLDEKKIRMYIRYQ